MPAERNNPIKREKIRKREELLNKGFDPYPHNWKRTSSVRFVRLIQNFESEEAQKPDKATLERSDQNKKSLVHIAGRLMRKRPMGKAAFFNIQDEKRELQCYIKRDDFLKSSSSEAQKNTDFPKDQKNISQSVPSSGDNNFIPTRSENFSSHRSEKTEKLQPDPYNKEDTGKNPELSPWELWKLCDIGDIVGLSGYLFKTKKGEVSLRVEDLQILCKTVETLPEKYHGLEDKELKYRYRHLDLIMDLKSRELFKIRSKIIREIRSFMNKKGFMEVETPVLQPIYGGAVAEPFTTYFRCLNQKMYLKISPEIYLKKLIVGGFEKVFEIGKNFRNEGIDRSHNPEFTMMEYYEAYTDYKDQMKKFEKLVCHVTKAIKGGLKFEYQEEELDFTRPWIRISLREFENLLYHKLKVENKGLFFEYQGTKWSCVEFFKEINREIQRRRKGKEKENNIGISSKVKRGKKPLDFEQFWKDVIFDEQNKKVESQVKRSQKKNNDLLAVSELIKTDKSGSINFYEKILNYVKSLEPKGDFEKFFDPLENKLPLSDFQLENLRGELVLLALELTVENHFQNPVFIMDFPLKSSPLTKKHRKHSGVVERFEPYIAGMEIGNAYTELNDPVDQRQRLEKQKRHSETFKKKQDTQKSNSEEAGLNGDHPMDENFLHALEVGMPPTGGVGLGIERLVMILTNQSNIRDSILFPVLRDKLK